MPGPAIADFGGRMLLREPSSDHREGQLRGLTIVIEYESLDAALAFYESDEYTAARLVREEAADTDLLLTEGV